MTKKQLRKEIDDLQSYFLKFKREVEGKIGLDYTRLLIFSNRPMRPIGKELDELRLDLSLLLAHLGLKIQHNEASTKIVTIPDNNQTKGETK